MRFNEIPLNQRVFVEKYRRAHKNTLKELSETRLKLNELLERESFLKEILDFIDCKQIKKLAQDMIESGSLMVDEETNGFTVRNT